MKDNKKFLEVLSEVVKELMHSPNETIEDTEKKVVEKLIRKGYDLEEITDTLDDIFENMDVLQEKELKMRILHPSELNNFSEEAKDYVLELKSIELIDEFEFEDIINHFYNYNYIVEIDVLKMILEKKGILGNSIMN